MSSVMSCWRPWLHAADRCSRVAGQAKRFRCATSGALGFSASRLARRARHGRARYLSHHAMLRSMPRAFTSPISACYRFEVAHAAVSASDTIASMMPRPLRPRMPSAHAASFIASPTIFAPPFSPRHFATAVRAWPRRRRYAGRRPPLRPIAADAACWLSIFTLGCRDFGHFRAVAVISAVLCVAMPGCWLRSRCLRTLAMFNAAFIYRFSAISADMALLVARPAQEARHGLRPI